MQYLSAAASLRLKYVCDRDSEMLNLEICTSGICLKSIFGFQSAHLGMISKIFFAESVRKGGGGGAQWARMWSN